MIIAKTFNIEAPIDKVWPIIIDPEQVAHCIPGCEKVEKVDEDNYTAVVKVAIGPIKTKFNVNISCTEKRPPEFASYESSGSEGGKASRVKATSELMLESLNDNETKVSYSSDINIHGRLGKFGSGMVLKVADSMGDDFVAGLKNVINNGSEAGGAEVQPVVAQTNTLNSLNKVVWIVSGVIAAAVIFALIKFI